MVHRPTTFLADLANLGSARVGPVILPGKKPRGHAGSCRSDPHQDVRGQLACPFPSTLAAWPLSSSNNFAQNSSICHLSCLYIFVRSISSANFCPTHLVCLFPLEVYILLATSHSTKINVLYHQQILKYYISFSAKPNPWPKH